MEYKMSQSDGSMGLEMALLSSWEGWDQGDSMSFMFYDAVLRVPIGDIPAGTVVSSVVLDYGVSTVAVFLTDQDETPTVKVPLKLSV